MNYFTILWGFHFLVFVHSTLTQEFLLSCIALLIFHSWYDASHITLSPSSEPKLTCVHCVCVNS